MKNRFIGIHADFIGFAASALCAIHCAALPFLLSLAPLVTVQYLKNPWIEYTIILISFLIAVYSLAFSYRRHHRDLLPIKVVTLAFILIATGQLIDKEWLEVGLSSTGAILVATGHLINWRKIKQSRIDNPNCIDKNDNV
ncbi:MerC domain-containing protein [Fulvivirga ligni]|uniref:MerC domain-containing protein n=1 Tax=Fulvivirga ligni TaxID=2904246 RepID=UPI001F24802C|nr:MerC domain-containing protein [Fulvivirga ligni]UII21271.1 MerC domain-containing protein [Fulvivirga ligni]